MGSKEMVVVDGGRNGVKTSGFQWEEIIVWLHAYRKDLAGSRKISDIEMF